MSNIKKVFLVIGTLFAAFIAWQIFFNEGGIVKTVYNATIKPINSTWIKMTGGTAPTDNILPDWDSTGVDNKGSVQDQNSGFSK